ncbi:Transcription factor iws1 [Metarhizium acridum]|uniref:Transcription factor iws1 n=1 Tax=Metarhizium acridum TaxID=92637 RepID=UPI001C6D1301|nr:Transcription factor iws1 [Metarhizium acridum]
MQLMMDRSRSSRMKVAAAGSDRDSDALSEIDENEFEDYDPETANIEDRPVDIDEDIARTLKATKRKRVAGDAPKKPREGRREKKRRDRDDDVAMEDGSEADGKAPRRARRTGEGERRRAKPDTPEPENEEELSPEERRKRAIDRALDAAIKKGGTTKRRRKDEIDLEDEIDEQLAELKVKMEKACRADNEARESNQPALHKLKLLPEVNAILNRNNVQHAVLDPDTNFLQHVKFFLEPLNDGSLPAYNIQRDLFTAMTKLNVEKEALLSSGIGKVVLFYTRSKKPEPSIKRMAERLLGEWSRPILKRTDDYKKRQIESRDYDYQYVKAVACLLCCGCWVEGGLADMMILGRLSWHNGKRLGHNSVSRNGRPCLRVMPSASVFWHQLALATAHA